MTNSNTTNLTPKTADLQAVLHAHFADCFSKEGTFDFEKFKTVLQQKEVDFFTESYSLQWLGKQYARLLATDPVTTLLRADEMHNALPENAHSQNLLLKGDNLEVLKHLTNAYYEKVKMIYIDPPYNTGSDGFVYQDDRKFTVPQLAQLAGVSEEVAQRILSFTQSKSNSHSAWLTFMYPRLYIARQLLKGDGVIFVSIDDNEVAQLRLLMDEVFGEDNFVSEFIWKSKSGGANDSRFFANDHEYILCYAKNTNKITINIDKNATVSTSYNLEDEKGKYGLDRLDKQSLGYLESLDFPIKGTDGIEYRVVHKNPNNKVARWRWSKETVKERYNELVFKDGCVYTKNYQKEGSIPRSLLIDERFGRTRTGKTDFTSLFEGAYFSAPKPIKLIKYLIEIGSNPNDLILDFFAGSGTTADAVMQLNAKDEGNRRFILVQLPELIDKKKNRTAYEAVLSFPSFVSRNLSLPSEPTIFDITKERLLRAAAKLKAEKNDLFNIKAVDLGFQIYETFPIWDDYEFETKDFNPSLTLFDETKLTEADLRALLLTWKTYDGIPLTESLAPVDLAGYEGYYGFDKLYLVHRGFTTESLKVLLEMMDNTPDFNPTTIVVFGYHFESAHLRQIAENVKAYANKKSISTDFIIRN
ncbi:site-specific DNA-methyltransferase [Capnocytophaga sputigena]|uniref:site-specific DNA-methyltransferase n=1 Tax=Capnocytophaga sputigena TaxID=1019 RepID=UPI0028D7013E|nr:site-specific DNA-methyltransferase [Capnocytophaga sputigena]